MKAEETPIFYRGQNYTTETYSNGAVVWSSAPQWILNETSGEYVPYIYWRDEVKKAYVVQTSLIAAEIFDTGVAKFWNPDMTEERVKSETWEIWKDDGGVWKEASLSSTITFNVTQTSTLVIIEAERATSKPTGVLMVRFIFREGVALKHDVFWTSDSAVTETIEVQQVWDLKLSTDRVILDDGNLVTVSTTTNSTTYLFGDNENDFLVRESQWSAVYYPDGTLRENGRFIEADIDFAGKKVAFTFSNWALTQGESLEIDPATATFSDPSQDGFAMYNQTSSTYSRDTSTTKIWAGTQLSGEILISYRGYSQWNIGSIPDPATITDTVFKYSGDLNNIDCHIHEMIGESLPSSLSNEDLFNEAGNGTTYADPYGFPVVENNQQVDLGTDADSDLQNQLSANWFAIGIVSDDEGTFTYSHIRSEEFSPSPTPPPTLYVEYTLPSIYITLETNPSGLQVRLDEGTWYNSPHEFEVESGTSHSIECNGIQSGGTRTQYIWESWNDTGANPHDVAPTVNTTYVATYKTQYQVYITSYPQGSGFVEFDGSPIVTPWTSDWYDSGTQKTVEATDKIITANQKRYAWTNWSPSGAKSHSISIDGGQHSAYFDQEWYFKVDSIYDDPTGEGWYVDGDSTVNSTVTTPVYENETSGWTGTGSLESGGTTGSNETGTFTITEYSTCTWIWNTGPSFEGFSTSKSPVKPHEVFKISTIIDDPTSYTDFVNATLAISNDVILKWDNSTNTFSIYYNPHSYVTLHDSNKTVLSSTSIKLTWEISLGSDYPEGIVNVLEANTKVYDNTGLVGSGAYTGLFVFQEEGGFIPTGSTNPSVPKQLVEKVVAPAVFGITDNMIAVVILVAIAVVAFILWRMEYETASKILAGGLVFLALNFVIAYILAPLDLLPDFLSFLGELSLKAPTLQLASFTVEEQNIIQILFLGATGILGLVIGIMALTNEVEL